MKIIDWYILKKFIGTFFFLILIFTVIAVVFDVSEKIEDYVNQKPPLSEIIFDWYFNFIPYLINLFIALFVFISVIYFTSQMANKTEIVPILNAGVSFNRFLFPYFIASCFFAILSFCLNSFILPHATKNMVEFENHYLKSKKSGWTRNIHQQISPGSFIYMESFNLNDSIGYKFSLEQFEDIKLKKKIMSDQISWDRTYLKWSLRNYVIRYFDGEQERLETGLKFDTILNFQPSDFGERNVNPTTMNNGEIIGYIKELNNRGIDKTAEYEVELYQRSALPFATFILVLIGASIASRKIRGGIGLHLGLGLALCFSYILFMRISSTFALQGGFPPLIAMWIPNVIFSVVALYIFKRAPK